MSDGIIEVDEATRVWSWKHARAVSIFGLERLELADQVADEDLDVHMIAKLIARGCTADLAVTIAR